MRIQRRISVVSIVMKQRIEEVIRTISNHAEEHAELDDGHEEGQAMNPRQELDIALAA